MASQQSWLLVWSQWGSDGDDETAYVESEPRPSLLGVETETIGFQKQSCQSQDQVSSQQVSFHMFLLLSFQKVRKEKRFLREWDL